MTTTDLAQILLVPLLLAVIYCDLRYMRLPNLLAALFVALFATTILPTLPLDVMAGRIGVGLAVLLIGMAANAAGMLGGGDVKVLSALVLFVPWQNLLGFSLILCLSMVAGILALLALRRTLRGRTVTWRGLQENGRYPVGLSIGLAGFAMLLA